MANEDKEWIFGMNIDIDEIEEKERPNRRDEALEAKGLLHDPIYRERSLEELNLLFPEYPLSPIPCTIHNEVSCTICNFKLSFDIDESDKYNEYLLKYGMVVIKLFKNEICDDTVNDMFKELNDSVIERKGCQEIPLSPNHPASWEKSNWPTKGKFLVRDPAFAPMAFKNRTSENLYHVYKNIFERDDLLCSIDNWGLFRGTKNLIFTEEEFNFWKTKRTEARKHFEIQYEKEHGEKPPADDIDKCNIRYIKNDAGESVVMMDRPDWRHNLKPHWDLNPWKWLKEIEKGEPEQYQSLLAINECPEEVGGFRCLPGSHIFVKEWCDEHRRPHNKRKTIRVPEDDQILGKLQNIPLRKGELVIWNSSLVHCNFPNYSDKMRLIQFIRMLPADEICTNKDRYASTRILQQYPGQKYSITSGELDISPLGLKLLGIEPWE